MRRLASMVVLAALVSACQTGGVAPVSLPASQSRAPSTEPPSPTTADASADILFKRNRNGGGEIWLVGTDGHGPSQLLPETRWDVSSWSPDGRLVAVTTDRDDRVFPSIVGADGSGFRELHPDPTLDCGAPTWTPDGRWIALECWDETVAGRDGIYVREVDGTGFHRLTRVHDLPGGFSPDGTRLVYTRDGTGEVRIVHADGTGDVSLGVTGARGVDWMPDGRSIIAGVDGKLVLMDDQGRITRRIEAPNGNAVEAHPSPDGEQLVFAFDLNDPNACCMSIATIGVDGSGFREIVPIIQGVEQSAPDWRSSPR